MNTILIAIFVIGYAAIAFEHTIKVNKTASALLTGVLCWVVYITLGGDTHQINEELTEHLGEMSGILFFLLGAMTIVELIDSHDGFDIITAKITTTKKTKLLWIIGMLTFFLSATLDNLTTTIVMVSLLKKLIDDKEDRLLFIGIVVISANAGGAWSPIGDVTTTMLWIGGQITAGNIVIKLFLPSLVCLIAPMLVLTVKLKGNIKRPEIKKTSSKLSATTHFQRNLIFYLGIGALVFVPIFKTTTHLPPFMGILFGLAILWVVTEIIHSGKNEEDKDAVSVVHALRKIDASSILFFLGILVAIASLQSTHILSEFAQFMNDEIGDLNIIVPVIGLLSAIVDNVPLVAASMGMYDIATYPQDAYLWEFLALCAGTGGSVLIIGSAAGVAAMGIEKIDFIWYVKKISFLALIGYFSGIICFMALDRFVF